MSAPFLDPTFAWGEVTPALFGRFDLAKFHTATATMRNIFVDFRGGGRSRAGTAFVGMSRQSPLSGQLKPRVISFEFSNKQTVVLEFGDFYVRFISHGAQVVEPGVAITGVSGTLPVTITAANTYSNGDWVALAGIGGATNLNGNVYVVSAATAANFVLLNLDGFAIPLPGPGGYTSGGTASRIYTIASPYAAADLALLKFAQSADVISLTHPNYPPQDLKRLGSTNWTITPTTFAATIAAPATITATATVNPDSGTTPPTLPCAYAYVVTAVDPVTGQESVASPIANITDSADMAVTAASEMISWSPVAGAQFYNVYRSPASYNTKPGDTGHALPVPTGAFFGFVGSSRGTQFVDNNITPDLSIAPPTHNNPFAPGAIVRIAVGASSSDWTNATAVISSLTGSGFQGQCVISGGAIVAVIIVNAGQNFVGGVDTVSFSGDGSSASGTLTVGPQTGVDPSVVSYFQQRRFYASSLNNPDTYWASQPGAFTNMDSAIPVSDSDAITATPWSEQVNGIEWMVQMPLGLVTFTGSGVWQIGAPGSFASSPQAITPANQIAAPQSSIGASPILPPIKVNWDILYAQVHGYTVRDLTYQLFFNIYTGTDCSYQSSHLLIGHTLQEWAWAEEPYRVVWAVREDGILLSFTFVKEQEIAGWARHDTVGLVRSVCSVTELPIDAVYLVVERPVPAGLTRFFIERMDNRIWGKTEDVWAVDCGLALPQPMPNASLSAGAASGNGVAFLSSPGVFTSGSVGQVIRMGGGIALVTGYSGPTQVTGNWFYPCQQTYPNDPTNSPVPQPSGAWSISPVVATVKAPHLALKLVTGLADGIVIPPQVAASDGTIALPQPSSNVVVGLGFTAQVQSIYADTGQPTVQGRRKAVTAVTARIEASCKLQAGANQVDASTLSPVPFAVTWPGLAAIPDQGKTYMSPGGGTVIPLFTGDERVTLPSDWDSKGQAAIQQVNPLPLNLLALIPELLPGDLPELEYTQRQPRGGAQGGERPTGAPARGRSGPTDLEMASIAQRGGFGLR